MKLLLEKLISQGKTDIAIKKLLMLSEKSDYKNLREEVLLQSSRYEEYAREKRLGIIDREESQIRIANINQALLYLTRQLPGEPAGISNIGHYNTNPKPFRSHYRQWIIGGVTTIVIIAGIIGFSGLSGEADVPLQLTVYVHGPENRQHVVLENEGELILDLQNDRRVAQIGANGRTNFGEIGRFFLGKKIPLSIKAPNWVMTHPDTSYIFDGKPVYLEVKSRCRYCTLAGTVQDSEGHLLSGVLVMVKGTQLMDTTDTKGHFHIQVPPVKEQEEYILSVIDDSQIFWEDFVTPSLKSPIEILLPN